MDEYLFIIKNKYNIAVVKSVMQEMSMIIKSNT